MGICSSCESTSVATAKLILQDGQLQEFPNPVKVSLVLQKTIPNNNNNMFFICDSDDMDFGGLVKGLNGDEELLLGQLYFVLPLSWLNHAVRAEDMAALAVRASLALGRMRGGKRCGCCVCKRVNHQVVFTTKKNHVRPTRMAVGGSHGSGGGHRETVRRGRGRGGGRRGGGGAGAGSFIRQLSVILEDEGRRDCGDMIRG